MTMLTTQRARVAVGIRTTIHLRHAFHPNAVGGQVSAHPPLGRGKKSRGIVPAQKNLCLEDGPHSAWWNEAAGVTHLQLK